MVGFFPQLELSRFSRISQFSRISRKWTFLTKKLFQKTPPPRKTQIIFILSSRCLWDAEDSTQQGAIRVRQRRQSVSKAMLNAMEDLFWLDAQGLLRSMCWQQHGDAPEGFVLRLGWHATEWATGSEPKMASEMAGGPWQDRVPKIGRANNQIVRIFAQQRIYCFKARFGAFWKIDHMALQRCKCEFLARFLGWILEGEFQMNFLKVYLSGVLSCWKKPGSTKWTQEFGPKFGHPKVVSQNWDSGGARSPASAVQAFVPERKGSYAQRSRKSAVQGPLRDALEECDHAICS